MMTLNGHRVDKTKTGFDANQSPLKGLALK